MPCNWHGTSGLVVKFLVAIEEPRVRFPAGANQLKFCHRPERYLTASGGGWVHRKGATSSFGVEDSVAEWLRR
jgi:hypothetical protein